MSENAPSSLIKTGPAPLGPGGKRQMFDFTKSNLILMVGGQILILAILLMVVFFGTAPLSFPANAVRNMISRNIPKS